MHKPTDLVVLMTVPFGLVGSIRVRFRVEAALRDNGVPYQITQDALTLLPGPTIRRLARGEVPRLYFLVRRMDYDKVRVSLLQSYPELEKYLDAQGL